MDRLAGLAKPTHLVDGGLLPLKNAAYQVSADQSGFGFSAAFFAIIKKAPQRGAFALTRARYQRWLSSRMRCVGLISVGPIAPIVKEWQLVIARKHPHINPISIEGQAFDSFYKAFCATGRLHAGPDPNRQSLFVIRRLLRF